MSTVVRRVFMQSDPGGSADTASRTQSEGSGRRTGLRLLAASTALLVALGVPSAQAAASDATPHKPPTSSGPAKTMNPRPSQPSGPPRASNPGPSRPGTTAKPPKPSSTIHPGFKLDRGPHKSTPGTRAPAAPGAKPGHNNNTSQAPTQQLGFGEWIGAIHGAIEIINLIGEIFGSPPQQPYDPDLPTNTGPTAPNVHPAPAPTPPATPGAQPPAGPVNPSKGSTGRSDPQNLKEKLAMEQAQSNPAAGKILPITDYKDGRWPPEDGWVKMQQYINGVNIHYMFNTRTGAADDWKFKE